MRLNGCWFPGCCFRRSFCPVRPVKKTFCYWAFSTPTRLFYLPDSTLTTISRIASVRLNMPTESTSKVVHLPVTKKADRTSEKKWGNAVLGQGFSIVPSLLLKAQRRLKLKPIELAILMHLADFWWEPDRKPYPSKERLAERLGVGPRQVQRWIANLEDAGLVQRRQRYASHGGKLTNEYDLSGLVKRLKELEPEFRQVEEEAKAKRRAVGRPGLRNRTTPKESQ